MLKEVQKARFRIEVYDLKLRKTKSKSFLDGENVSVEQIMEMIIHCINKREYMSFKRGH